MAADNLSPHRILHIITGLGTGGAEMMLYKLLSRLDRGRFDPVVLTLTESGPVGKMIEDLGIPVHALHLKPGSMNPLDVVALIRKVRGLSPRLVQTWLYKADLIGAIAAWVVGRIPVVWGIRSSILAPHHTGRSTLLARWLCARSSGWLPTWIVSCSHVGADVHVKLGYARRKISVIPNGFDLSEFQPDEQVRQGVREELGVKGELPLIVHIGRIDPLKDYPTLIAAAGALKTGGHPFRMALCGLGIDESNMELGQGIREHGLQDHVRLLGPRSDVRRLLQGADLLVSSSFGEGFPNVIGEAMASARPCAVTDAGDSAVIVGDTGRVAPVRNPQALSEAMASLIALPKAERMALGDAARERIASHYELGAVVRQFEDLYLDLISRRNRSD